MRACYLENGLVTKDVSGTAHFERFYDEFSLVRFSDQSTEEKLVEEALGMAAYSGYRVVFFVLTKWQEGLEKIVPMVRQGLCAAVYTQVSDVEDETNGLLTFDRKIAKIRPEEFRDVADALAATMNGET